VACDPWPYDTSCLPAEWPATGVIVDDLADMTPQQRSAYDAAVELLGALSFGVFGTCTMIARPCAACCAYGAGFSLGAGGWFSPYLYGGRVYNGCGCASMLGCGCGAPAASVHLDGPVADVVQVLVDGLVVDPAAYVVRGSTLVRIDGGVWPMSQDLTLPPTEAGTFQVTYVQGTPLSVAGQRALSAFMIELEKARCGDLSCKLPARVTNVVREGVTYTLMDDPSSILDGGRTGIAEVDQWLAAINPSGARTRMRVYSPDVRRRTTWSA
jgi:hypothetical protein